jgi:hypothetical protein
MRRIATLNDNGNSGSSIATPSRLHKRGRGTQKLDVRRSPLGGTLKHLGIEILAEMVGIAQKIESYNSAYRLAWQHISEHQKREQPDIAQRLHDSSSRRGQLKVFSLPPRRLRILREARAMPS